jgi:hypothetical protein
MIAKFIIFPLKNPIISRLWQGVIRWAKTAENTEKSVKINDK